MYIGNLVTAYYYYLCFLIHPGTVEYSFCVLIHDKYSWIENIFPWTQLNQRNTIYNIFEIPEPSSLGTFRLTYQLWKQVILDHCLVWPVSKGKHHRLNWLSPWSTAGMSHNPSESISTDYFTYWAIYLPTMSWGNGKKFNYILKQSVFSPKMIASTIKANLNFITACGKCFLCAPYHEILLSTGCCGIHRLFCNTVCCNQSIQPIIALHFGYVFIAC